LASEPHPSCMPRFARVVVPQCPHHVTQRGNERRDIFFTPADREVYLGLTKQYATLHSVEVLGYCLMTNHVHLVLLPGRAESLARLMRQVQMRYSQYRHALERGSGHLWQSRYYSCPVAPEHLGAVMRYVELNPVRAGLVVEAVDYRWSSAAVHLGGPDAHGIISLEDWRRCWTAREWAAVLREQNQEGAAIREATFGGRPLGHAEFVGRLETFLGRRLKRGSPGRPRKRIAHEAAADGAEI
jgi:putative transposase